MNREDVARYNVTELLRDQRTVTIRAVRPDDKGLVIEAFREASPESIYRRVFAAKKELSDQELKLITEVDFVNVVQLQAPGHRAVGALEVVERQRLRLDEAVPAAAGARHARPLSGSPREAGGADRRRS